MNRIEEVFGVRAVLLPVVHPVGRQEALAAVRVACDLGVKGVFLIDQVMHERDVLALVREIRDLHPALWVGVNLLSRAPAEALAIALDACGTIDGIWSDNAGIDERGSPSPDAEALVAMRHATRWRGLYFGGVAFKYQRQVALEDLGRAASMATAYMDVICTSGPGTGYAADVEKVRALCAGLGDHAMALASGITPQNVRGYLPYVQAFLVGTGIERQFGVLDPPKVEALLRALQQDE
jgi:predicted TIM-barrel enzyme